MPSATDALRAELPLDLYALVGPLFRGTPKPVIELRDLVDDYIEALEKALNSRNWPDMDIDMGRACGLACVALLDHVGAEPDADAHMLTHIAVQYFVTSEDDEDDLDSLVGFDDDALVINACARVLGASAAVIPLAPR